MSDTINGTRQFAYYTDSYECVGCPAVQAGFDSPTQSDLLNVIHEFDGLVAKDRNRYASGLISEPLAKECWLAAIENVAERNGEDEDEIRLAREIADEFGWEEDDE